MTEYDYNYKSKTIYFIKGIQKMNDGCVCLFFLKRPTYRAWLS